MFLGRETEKFLPQNRPSRRLQGDGGDLPGHVGLQEVGRASTQAQTRGAGPGLPQAPPPPRPDNEQQRGQDGEAEWACSREQEAGGRLPQHGQAGQQRADTDRQHRAGVRLRTGSAPPKWALGRGDAGHKGTFCQPEVCSSWGLGTSPEAWVESGCQRSRAGWAPGQPGASSHPARPFS